MDLSKNLTLRLFGLSGIIGSILFIFGDLFYNHISGSTDSVAVKMSNMPESRLLMAGALGLIGCWFYTLSSLHLFIAFRPSGDLFAFFVASAFAALMICYGVDHAAYFSIASGARVAAIIGFDIESGGKLGHIFFKRLEYLTYIPVLISSLMMIYGIIIGKSLYPRWMVVFLPVVIYLLKVPIILIFKGPLKEIINDSYDNIVFFVFFILSTIVLWNSEYCKE
jgi:hypothetical protein